MEIKIDDVERGKVFDDEEWDPDQKIPLATFVSDEHHAHIDADTPKNSSEEKKHPFRNTFSSPIHRLCFVPEHHHKSHPVDEGEEDQ